MEFKIGDRVKVKEYAEIPEDIRNKRIASLSGHIGTVEDKLWSDYNGCYVYRILFDGSSRKSSVLWTEDSLDKHKEHTAEYKYEMEVSDNVVIAYLYEIVGDTKTLVARGHGHIMHDGVIGIAQAGSYALKKLYTYVNGGSF